MNKLMIVALLACLSLGCKKEYSDPGGPVENTSSIDLSLDDEDIAKQYSPDQHNEFDEYSFGGVAGNYFGYISTFKISDKEGLEIRFGTLLSQHSQLTIGEMLLLIAPGKREYGSLGAFSSFPQTKPGCAEIAFTDKKSMRWCSTAIMEKMTDYGIDAEVSINQPDGEFIIEKVKALSSSDSSKGYQVSGRFKCRVYQVNGKRSREMKGNFSGVVGSSN